VVRAPGEAIDLPGGVPVPVTVVHDERPYEGPLAGISAGLAAAAHPLALVAGGDMPGLVHAVLVALLTVAEESGATAVALRDGGHYRPLPHVVRRDAVGVADELLREGRRSLYDFLDAVEVAGLSEEVWRRVDPFARTLADIDVPGDPRGDGPDPGAGD
jgi:molybdopterin-guanine dinucleotide biosynthesis protein A